MVGLGSTKMVFPGAEYTPNTRSGSLTHTNASTSYYLLSSLACDLGGVVHAHLLAQHARQLVLTSFSFAPSQHQSTRRASRWFPQAACVHCAAGVCAASAARLVATNSGSSSSAARASRSSWIYPTMKLTRCARLRVRPAQRYRSIPGVLRT